MADDSRKTVLDLGLEALPVSGGNGKTGATVDATDREIELTGTAIPAGAIKYVTIMSNQDIIFRQGPTGGAVGEANTAKLLKNTYLQLVAHQGFDFLLYVRDTTDGKLWIMYHEWS